METALKLGNEQKQNFEELLGKAQLTTDGILMIIMVQAQKEMSGCKERFRFCREHLNENRMQVEGLMIKGHLERSQTNTMNMLLDNR